MGWLKDALIVLALVLGIAAVARGLQAGPGRGQEPARGAVQTHLDSCAECRTELGHLHCPEMRRIRRALTRRILEQYPWMGDGPAEYHGAHAPARPADPAP